MKKLPNTLSNEELLASLGNTPDNTTPDSELKPVYRDRVLSFLSAFDIKPGTNRCTTRFMYKLFRAWDADSRMNRQHFTMEVMLYIPHRIFRSNRHEFLIDADMKMLIKKYDDSKRDYKLKTKSKKWQNQFHRFMSQNSLERGTLYVESDILYYVYNNWLDKTRNKALFSRRTFYEMCNTNFDRKRIAGLQYFGVNEKIKDMIDKEAVERWRQGRAKYGKKKENIRDSQSSTDGTEEVLYKDKTKSE